ncbi:hypothetical protein Hanom_Chr03g00213511 [Helianthus anomalus]
MKPYFFFLFFFNPNHIQTNLTLEIFLLNNLRHNILPSLSNLEGIYCPNDC